MRLQGGVLLEELVTQLSAFVLLPGGEKCLSASVREPPGLVGLLDEVLGAELTTIHQGQDEAIHQWDTELLHQVECQRESSGSLLVEESHGGVQAHSCEGCGAILHQQGISEGEQRVDAILRWTV